MEIIYKNIDLSQDLDDLIKLTKEAANLSRFVKEEDLTSYSLLFVLNDILDATYILGAYHDSSLVGLITANAFNIEKIFKNNKNIEELVKNLDKKFSDYNFLNNNHIYRETVLDLLKETKIKFESEISLFVVDSSYRKEGIGKYLLNEALNYLKNNNIKNVFLSSDSECNYKYYLKSDFQILKEKMIHYENEDSIKIFIEGKEIS